MVARLVLTTRKGPVFTHGSTVALPRDAGPRGGGSGPICLTAVRSLSSDALKRYISLDELAGLGTSSSAILHLGCNLINQPLIRPLHLM